MPVFDAQSCVAEESERLGLKSFNQEHAIQQDETLVSEGVTKSRLYESRLETRRISAISVSRLREKTEQGCGEERGGTRQFLGFPRARLFRSIEILLYKRCRSSVLILVKLEGTDPSPDSRKRSPGEQSRLHFDFLRS
ncbi:hypothetical protein F2Q70_00013262 [Brassica cretica]|uniref:Uncharacterized protein n=1 Tax=Brassica cretica TaxID=69181 RepID=A0A8S9MAP0_BRACR|nr:hypothetical protein F2Q70_00013262 [Brassica cretica]